MKISVLGDVMLSRLIGEKYEKTNYNIVSNDVKQKLRKSDYVIANLESPILDSDDDFDEEWEQQQRTRTKIKNRVIF